MCAWIEVRNPGDQDQAVWQAYERVNNVPRNYDAFGCLFGATNYLDFPPVAAERGLPPDVSTPVQAAATEMAVDSAGFAWPTWVSWAELKAIDWCSFAISPSLRTRCPAAYVCFADSPLRDSAGISQPS